MVSNIIMLAPFVVDEASGSRLSMMLADTVGRRSLRSHNCGARAFTRHHCSDNRMGNVHLLCLLSLLEEMSG